MQDYAENQKNYFKILPSKFELGLAFIYLRSRLLR